MWSKKNVIIIILIVAVAIFAGSLAFGLPWWQALLLGVVFLLVTALVFGGGGLLIPEALFNIVLPKEPPEADTKDDFFKKMDSALAEFSAQSEASTEDVHWMTEYTRVMKGVGELVYEVHESVKSKDSARQLQAFRKVTKELPRLISQFKDIPEVATLKDRGTMRRQAQGLDLYLVACSDFAEAIEKSDGSLAGQAAVQISRALDLLDIIAKPSAVPRW